MTYNSKCAQRVIFSKLEFLRHLRQFFFPFDRRSTLKTSGSRKPRLFKFYVRREGVATDRSGVWQKPTTENEKNKKNASSDFHAAVSTGDSRPRLVPIFPFSAPFIASLSAGQRSTLSRITPPPRHFSLSPLSRDSPVVFSMSRPVTLPL